MFGLIKDLDRDVISYMNIILYLPHKIIEWVNLAIKNLKKE